MIQISIPFPMNLIKYKKWPNTTLGIDLLSYANNRYEIVWGCFRSLRGRFIYRAHLFGYICLISYSNNYDNKNGFRSFMIVELIKLQSVYDSRAYKLQYTKLMFNGGAIFFTELASN